MTPTDLALPQLLSTLRTWPRADKLRLVQFLVDELAREEGISQIEAGASYPIWTPHNAFDAAATLLRALQTEGSTP
jgi:hypothetical protein